MKPVARDGDLQGGVLQGSNAEHISFPLPTKVVAQRHLGLPSGMLERGSALKFIALERENIFGKVEVLR